MRHPFTLVSVYCFRNHILGSQQPIPLSLFNIFMAIIYAFFFRLIAGVRAPVESIVIGVFAWQFTAVSVSSGMNCITGNANLIKKVAFPRSSLPVAVILAGMIVTLNILKIDKQIMKIRGQRNSEQTLIWYQGWKGRLR